MGCGISRSVQKNFDGNTSVYHATSTMSRLNEVNLQKSNSGNYQVAAPVLNIDKAEKLQLEIELLKSLTSYENEEALNALQKISDIYWSCDEDKGQLEAIGNYLAVNGFIELFLRIKKLTNHQDLFSLDKEAISSSVYFKFYLVTRNVSNDSPHFCAQLGVRGAIELLLNDLSDPELNCEAINQETSNKLSTCRRLLKSTLGILHNSIRLYESNVGIFRQSDAFNLLEPYLKSQYLIIRASSLLILVYIINEDENERITTNEENIAFLVKLLKSALDSEGHYSKTYLFDSVELVEGLIKLAANDSNKTRIVDQGALPLLVQMLHPGFSDQEHQLSAKCLWTLAFNENNKEKIKNEINCLQLLKNLASKENGSHAKGALFVLGALEDTVEPYSVENRTETAGQNYSTEKDNLHIMISYQWDAQPIMIKVKDLLKEAGYRVWMDIEAMAGSTLEAMAEAIEKSAVVLICMSQKYKDSPSTRTEAEYTYKLQKDIIPLKLEKDYNADGWLGIMTGTKLYFDVSSREKVNLEVPKLIKELGTRGLARKPTKLNDSIATIPVVHSLTPDMNRKILSSSLEKWTVGEVENWLTTIGLFHMIGKFKGFDGQMINGLKMISSESPDFFYSALKSDLGFKNLRDIVKFRLAIQNVQ